MVTSTNWDLAYRQPKNFDTGVFPIQYRGSEYLLHRWTDNYQAVTHKHPAIDDELFKGEYYYYEIDWRPTEIIWRIGPSPDKMRIVGYMNENVTQIPDNQMVSVITQEFHYADWWPMQPFSQNYVPYPKNNIQGKVFGIMVE